MKMNTSKEVWIARIIVWVVLCMISVGMVFGATFILGPSLFAVPNLTEKIAISMYCPSAESTSLEEGASTQTTTSPTGTYGHTVEVTCYFPDGSTKTINNGEYAVASIGGVLGIGGLIGILISIPLLLLPFIIIRKKKNG